MPMMTAWWLQIGLKVVRHPFLVTEPIYPVGIIFLPLAKPSLYMKVIPQFSAFRSMAPRSVPLPRHTPADQESGRSEIGLAPAKLTTDTLQRS